MSFKHKECEPYLQEAQQEVIRRMSNFDDNTGLTETMNQAAREYHTVLKNGVWMNFTKWQTKFVIAELRNTELPKAAWQFVIKKILQIVNQASKGPEASRYKSKLVSHVPFMELEGDTIRKRLEATMTHIPEIKDSDDWYVKTAKSILKNIFSASRCNGNARDPKRRRQDAPYHHPSAEVQSSSRDIWKGANGRTM